MNYYEVLGVQRDATDEEVRHAYLAKAAQLRPERFVEAPDDVIAAVNRASVVIGEAWNVLGDVALRARYDSELDQAGQISVETHGHRSTWRHRHAEHVWAMERELGLPLTSVLGVQPPNGDDASKPYPDDAQFEGLAGKVMSPSQQWLVSPIYDPLACLETLANWLGPHEKISRTVTVPNVCGMRASEVFYAVAQADLRINFVRLTEHPTGDGIVVDQHPPAGVPVRRNSTLTVQVVHKSVGQSET
jgi:hypothetical protein